MNIKFFAVMVCALVNVVSADIIINEFHYDNMGGDVGEFIEIASSDTIANPSNVLVSLYNGSNGEFYKTKSLDEFTSHGQLTDGYYYYSLMIIGIQNGSPDGIALSQGGSLIEFISYEGSFQASNGAADGITSTDILVSESISSAIGSSLQRQNFGNTWIFTDGTNTMGQINTGNINPVPVPGSCLLAMIGLGWIQTTRRRLSRSLA